MELREEGSKTQNLRDPSANGRQPEPALSIVVPTKNEAGNIEALLTRILPAVSGIPTEVIFVDDSSDQTAQVIQCSQDQYSPLEVTLIARPPERRGNGLGGAVVEGFRVARAPWVCVMDGDLQHSPELISQLIDRSTKTRADIVVGSRLARGGDTRGLGRGRSVISRVFAKITRATFPLRLRHVSDPLSGLFLARREAVDLDRLRPDGFKILLEILIRCPDLRVSEIPIRFGHRHAGQSKATKRETLRLFRLMLRLRLAGYQRLAGFLTVGASGLVVNNLLLAAFTELAGIHYLLSAALATQGSTLWNFSLTELWVFGDRRAERPVLIRLIPFLLMNNVLLLLRGPVLVLLVSGFGVHYLLSNLITLVVTTLLRYVISDQWIWSHVRKVHRPESFAFAYDIHGILQIVSMFRLPELEHFRVSGPLDRPQIRLRQERRSKARRSGGSIHYDEGLGRYGFEVTIDDRGCVEVAVSPLVRRSPHVLYTNVIEPILRWAFVREGYALVHGACLAFNEKAYMLTARTDTGKTTTLLRILSRQRRSTDRVAFISDDLTLVSPDGRVLTYPKPLTISHHTVQAVNPRALSTREHLALLFQSRIHSRSGRKTAFWLARTRLPMATINAVVQILIPPPKYFVQRLVPKVKLASEAKLAGLFVIERGTDEEEVHLEGVEALEILLSNCEDAYGFPPYDSIKEFLYHSNGHDLREVEKRIIAEAFQNIPATLIRSRKMEWWRRIPVSVDQEMVDHFVDRKELSRPVLASG